MSIDVRAKQLADLLLSYSVKLNSRDTLLIHSEEYFADFVDEIAIRAQKIGAKVLRDYSTYDGMFTRGLIERNDPAEWQSELERRCKLALDCTARIWVDATSYDNPLGGINTDKIAEYNSKLLSPFKKVLYREDSRGNTLVKWNITGYPSEIDARGAGMTSIEFADFVYGSTLIDWKKLDSEMIKVKSIFDKAKKVTVYDYLENKLEFSLASRKGCVARATHNMPSGEVFYCPEEKSLNGRICFQVPAKRDGVILKNIELVFNSGKIVYATAQENNNFLQSMLGIKGARGAGEFGIGCNYGITRPTTNLLFDEKIGGTIHLALGEAVSTNLNDGGGLAKSDIHWDLVSDLRPTNGNNGGRIYVNDQLVQENGIWIFK